MKATKSKADGCYDEGDANNDKTAAKEAAADFNRVFFNQLPQLSHVVGVEEDGRSAVLSVGGFIINFQDFYNAQNHCPSDYMPS